MANISVNNGLSTTTAANAIDEVGFATIANYMDREIMENVHNFMAPCTDLEFLSAYLNMSDTDIIVG